MVTDYGGPGIVLDMIRSFFAFLDKIAYGLLGAMYALFFNVAGAELFETATIKNFYSRVQLIIGVFMLFKLAVSILQGIMNPDKFTDAKQGFGSVITRVIVSLAMLTIIVPINIPDAEPGSFNARLNNDGLLFGVLYSLQDRVLSNNTLGRLILGTSDNLTPSDEEKDKGITAADKQAETLSKSANLFSTTILRGFFRVNLVEGATDETKADYRLCPDEDSGKLIRGVYAAEDATPTQILSLVNENCETAGFFTKVGNIVGNTVKNISNFLLGTDFETKQTAFYIFSYSPVLSTIVAIIFIVVLLGFTIDIAIRAIKLSILRLIAPIPIISYIDPKSSEKGAFASWVKALSSTYLDVFLRLAIVYFVIFLIQDMIQNGIFMNDGTGFVGILTCILIWIGLFIFAKQAPKFIKDVLGIKGLGMSNLGLNGMLAAVGAIRQGGSIMDTAEAVQDVTRAQSEAYNQGKAGPSLGDGFNFGRDHAAKILTGDQNMTGRKMSRGARHLKAMNINAKTSSAAKDAYYDMQGKADAANDLYKRFVEGNASEAEVRSWARNNDYQYDSARGTLKNNKTGKVSTARQTLYDNQADLTTKAGKLKKKYDDISGMQKQYGGARSYEAQYEGEKDENGHYQRRNLRNRSIAGLGLHSSNSKNQFFRSQNLPEGGSGTSATNPRDSGVDRTGIGDTTTDQGNRYD